MIMYCKKNNNNRRIANIRARPSRLDLSQVTDEVLSEEEYQIRRSRRAFPLHAPRAIVNAFDMFVFSLPESPVCVFDFAVYGRT